MLSRIEFYDLEQNLLELGIEISEITKRADNFITYLNSMETTLETTYKIEMMTKAEDKTKEMLQIIMSKTNPDLNRIIEIDSQQNDSHKVLIYCLGMIQAKIEKQKEDLIKKLSNIEKLDSNKVTNKTTLDFYSSYIKEVFNDIIFNPIQEAFLKYSSIEEPATNSRNYIEKYVKNFGDGSVMRIEKNETLFWYFVFSYLFRASQVIGFASEGGRLIPKPLDVTDIKKLIRVAQKQIASPSPQGQQKTEPPIKEEKSEEKSVQKNPEETEEIEEEFEEEDLDEEEDEIF